MCAGETTTEVGSTHPTGMHSCLLKCFKFSINISKTLKNTGKMDKHTGKGGKFCQSGKVGTMKR